MWLVAQGCSTSSGAGKKRFWQDLVKNQNNSRSVADTEWKLHKKDPLPPYQIHLRKDLPDSLTHRERINAHWSDAWTDLQSDISGSNLKSSSLGLIVASTKGFIEDVVWEDSATPIDTLTPLLGDFQKLTGLSFLRKTVISNACASGAVAMQLAQQWLNSGHVEDVLIASADVVGEFVLRGFQSLNALTPEKRAKPFDKNRSGLQLGEGASVLWVSRTRQSEFKIGPVGVNCEGVAATRPDEQGRSLYIALNDALKNSERPSLIVAHGTGTALNDATEDFVFGTIYGEKINAGEKPLITGTKWCIGHTLGASSSLDLIATAEILKNRRVFSLAFTEDIDEKFAGKYATGTGTTEFLKNSALISSLGFGGVHAGLLLTREAP